ncbi:hypothetical protein Ddye_015994 [Dipteronia dyeriana]|uniref:Uncharacterized protein n=1 Tax=Dipteronia dyeriana TaxID=168575 RepID=A0AAD9U6Q8_9ROSI|nr:hypothetical protein Ddye_015994 [Dipteronia dyeriana]
MREALDLFCDISGQQIIFPKSRVHCLNNVSRGDKELTDVCGSPISQNLGNYLGVPLIHGRVMKGTYIEIIKKTQKTLAAWKSAYLSLAGFALVREEVSPLGLSLFLMGFIEELATVKMLTFGLMCGFLIWVRFKIMLLVSSRMTKSIKRDIKGLAVDLTCDRCRSSWLWENLKCNTLLLGRILGHLLFAVTLWFLWKWRCEKVFNPSFLLPSCPGKHILNSVVVARLVAST